MIGRGKLFLNSPVEKLLRYVAITRATGFRLSLLDGLYRPAANIVPCVLLIAGFGQFLFSCRDKMYFNFSICFSLPL